MTARPMPEPGQPRTVTVEQVERVLFSVLDDTDGANDLIFDVLARLAEVAASPPDGWIEGKPL